MQGFSKSKIGIYEKALPMMSWENYFYTVASAGFDFMEISLDDNPSRLERLNLGINECHNIRKLAEDAGLTMQSLCLSAHKRYPLGSCDPNLRKKGMDILKKCINICSFLGIRVILVTGFCVYYEPETKDTLKWYTDSLSEAAQWADSNEIMLAVEPVEKGLTTVHDVKKVINLIDSPWVRIYADPANMAGLGIDPIPEIRNNIQDCVAMHIREALPDYYDNVEFGQGILDFDALFKMLAELNWNCPLMIEMWNHGEPNYYNKIAQARTFIEKKWLKYHKC